jgi:hypothetical protein
MSSINEIKTLIQNFFIANNDIKNIINDVKIFAQGAWNGQDERGQGIFINFVAPSSLMQNAFIYGKTFSPAAAPSGSSADLVAYSVPFHGIIQKVTDIKSAYLSNSTTTSQLNSNFNC